MHRTPPHNKELANPKPIMWRNPKHNTKFLVSNSPTAEGDMQLTNVQLTLEQHGFELYQSTYWRRQWHPTPVFLPGESRGRRSLVGCRLWGRTELDVTEATQQQQQSTYTWIFFSNSKYYSTTHDPRLDESADVEESQIWWNRGYRRPNTDFQLYKRSVPLIPTLFKVNCIHHIRDR